MLKCYNRIILNQEIQDDMTKPKKLIDIQNKKRRKKFSSILKEINKKYHQVLSRLAK